MATKKPKAPAANPAVKTTAAPKRKTAARPAARKPPPKRQITAKLNPQIKTKPDDADLFSISALSRKFNLDRATVKTRLDAAGIEPVKTSANERLYALEDVSMVLTMRALDAAKLAKTNAEAQLKDLELKKRQGDFASVAEFSEIVQQLFGRLHKRLAVQMPGRIAKKLHDAHSAAAVSAMLQKELEKDFADIRNDFQGYLGRA